MSLQDACLNSRELWDAAVARLKHLGLTVAKEMNVVGVVAGTVPESKVPALESDPHVVKVESDERRTTR